MPGSEKGNQGRANRWNEIDQVLDPLGQTVLKTVEHPVKLGEVALGCGKSPRLPAGKDPLPERWRLGRDRGRGWGEIAFLLPEGTEGKIGNYAHNIEYDYNY